MFFSRSLNSSLFSRRNGPEERAVLRGGHHRPEGHLLQRDNQNGGGRDRSVSPADQISCPGTSQSVEAAQRSVSTQDADLFLNSPDEAS